MSLTPYLNERNVVSNINIPDIFFEYPDRELNPIPSAPQKTIFYKNSNLSEEPRIEIQEQPRMTKTLVTSVNTDVNHQNELMFARNKINELMKEIQILQNSMKKVYF